MKDFAKETYNRFDAYDFFALWGGGIVVLTYCFCMLYLLLRDKLFSIVSIDGQITDFISNNVVITFVFVSVFAYFFGLILHELGRWIFDVIGNVFGCESVSDLLKLPISKKLNIEKNKRPNAFFKSNKYAFWLCKKRIEDFEKNNQDVKFDRSVSLFYMESFLKTKGVSVSKKYSSYGIARSIFVGSIINDIIVLIVIAFNSNVEIWTSILVIALSLIVNFVMYGKTYKAYLAYLRNVYAAFYMAKV